MQHPARCLQPLNVEPELEGSYNISNGCYTQANVEVHRSGVRLREYDVEFSGLHASDMVQVRKLGSGVSGTVYLHKHRTEGLMAIKKINISDKTKRQQLKQELRALYGAECPCLVKFYGAFLEDLNVNIALEYMDRGCLRELINQGPIPELYVAAIARQVICGVGWLHEASLVHRDLKPENILCDSGGHVKVADFGTSRSTKDSVGACRTFVGTAKYMSPERYASKEYNWSCDVWSLGIIFHECLSGSHPYNSLKSIDLIFKIRDERPPEPPAGVSLECGELLSKCLQKDPASRSTIKEMFCKNDYFQNDWLDLHNMIDLGMSRYAVKSFLEARPSPYPSKLDLSKRV